MANTKIQIKRSSTTAVPTSLDPAELAISFNSNKLFIGNGNSAVVAIGGQYFVDQQNTIFNHANAAHVTANAAFDKANGSTQLAYKTVLTGSNTLTASSNAATLNLYSSNGISILSNSQNLWVSVSLDKTAVTPTTYGGDEVTTPYFTVDAQGRITAAGNVTVTNAAAIAVSSNAWTNAVFGYANTNITAVANGWANSVGVAANAYAVTVGAASNGWANLVAGYANSYANLTFLKLTGGTVTGDLTVSGNLVVGGNSTVINTQSLNVVDPLIYLAGNNYSSDVVDIGFVANYVNATGQNVHTGFFRDATIKEYYVFNEYSGEPEPNHIDTAGNNFTIAILNATLRTSNIILNGVNAYATINAAFEQANSGPLGANAYAVTVGAASNGWANSIGASSNAWTNAVFGYANTNITAVANGWANTVVAGANAWTNAVFGYANTNITAVANGWANSVGVAANAYALSLATNINGANITSGTVVVARGGTGNTTFTTNGILFGNGTGPILVTAAGTDGQVLQSDQGLPKFAMLDGGTF